MTQGLLTKKRCPECNSTNVGWIEATLDGLLWECQNCGIRFTKKRRQGKGEACIVHSKPKQMIKQSQVCIRCEEELKDDETTIDPLMCTACSDYIQTM